MPSSSCSNIVAVRVDEDHVPGTNGDASHITSGSIVVFFIVQVQTERFHCRSVTMMLHSDRPEATGVHHGITEHC